MNQVLSIRTLKLPLKLPSKRLAKRQLNMSLRTLIHNNNSTMPKPKHSRNMRILNSKRRCVFSSVAYTFRFTFGAGLVGEVLWMPGLINDVMWLLDGVRWMSECRAMLEPGHYHNLLFIWLFMGISFESTVISDHILTEYQMELN